MVHCFTLVLVHDVSPKSHNFLHVLVLAHAQDPSKLFVLKKVKVDEDNDRERCQAEMEVKVLSNLDHPLVLGCENTLRALLRVLHK